MTLPKPERVEVGQWWVPKHGEDSPWRIEPEHLERGKENEPADPEWSWLVDGYDYAGNGAHPEPSDWMIETLLEHAKKVAPKASDRYDAATIRHVLNGGTTASMDPREGPAMNRSVVSVYLILRSLGKW